MLPACVTEPGQSSDRVDPEWLAGEALQALGPDGRFAVVAANPEYAGERSLQEAELFGQAYVRSIPTRVGSLEEDIEGRHGAEIQFSALRPCGRSFFLKSSFEPVSSPPHESTAATHTAGRWLLTYCTAHGAPAVLLNVFAASLLTNDLDFSNPLTASDFFPVGIPLALPNLVTSPEFAVSKVYQAVGTRVTKIEAYHDLFTIGPIGENGRPLGAYWRVEVERETTVTRDDGSPVTSRTFYLGAFHSSPVRQAAHIGGVPLDPFVERFQRIDPITGSSSLMEVLIVPREPLTLRRIR